MSLGGFFCFVSGVFFWKMSYSSSVLIWGATQIGATGHLLISFYRFCIKLSIKSLSGTLCDSDGKKKAMSLTNKYPKITAYHPFPFSFHFWRYIEGRRAGEEDRCLTTMVRSPSSWRGGNLQIDLWHVREVNDISLLALYKIIGKCREF